VNRKWFTHILPKWKMFVARKRSELFQVPTPAVLSRVPLEQISPEYYSTTTSQQRCGFRIHIVAMIIHSYQVSKLLLYIDDRPTGRLYILRPNMQILNPVVLYGCQPNANLSVKYSMLPKSCDVLFVPFSRNLMVQLRARDSREHINAADISTLGRGKCQHLNRIRNFHLFPNFFKPNSKPKSIPRLKRRHSTFFQASTSQQPFKDVQRFESPARGD
jgi:hypothetical protein